MRTNTPIILLLAFITFSCQDKIKDTYIVNEPVYLSYNDLREAVNIKSAQDIIQPGKLYFKDHNIFVNEYMTGIHVVDNSDPSDPKILKFIEVPGNVDLAVKQNILYADSYVDLVALDISDLENIREVARVENAFPYMIPDYETGMIEQIDESKGVITGWTKVERTVNVGTENREYIYYRGWSEEMLYADMSNMALSDGGGGSEKARSCRRS